MNDDLYNEGFQEGYALGVADGFAEGFSAGATSGAACVANAELAGELMRVLAVPRRAREDIMAVALQEAQREHPGLPGVQHQALACRRVVRLLLRGFVERTGLELSDLIGKGRDDGTSTSARRGNDVRGPAADGETRSRPVALPLRVRRTEDLPSQVSTRGQAPVVPRLLPRKAEGTGPLPRAPTALRAVRPAKASGA